MLGQWVYLTPTKLLLSIVDTVICLSSDVIRGLLQLLLLLWLRLLVRSARLKWASNVLTSSAHMHMLMLQLLLWHVLQLCTVNTLWLLLLLLLIVHALLGSV